MQEVQKEKAIIKKDKSGEVVIFWLEDEANRYNICCNGVISERELWAGSEASYEYYRDCVKATDDEVAMAKKAAKACYGIDIVLKHKISKNDRKAIWPSRR